MWTWTWKKYEFQNHLNVFIEKYNGFGFLNELSIVPFDPQ
jgi:hypothetical protein